jgi:hypothetical protein
VQNLLDPESDAGQPRKGDSTPAPEPKAGGEMKSDGEMKPSEEMQAKPEGADSETKEMQEQGR